MLHRAGPGGAEALPELATIIVCPGNTIIVCPGKPVAGRQAGPAGSAPAGVGFAIRGGGRTVGAGTVTALLD